MNYRILHRTTYAGDEAVSVGHNQAWLRPRELPHQSCVSYALEINPAPSMLTWQTDYFGNALAAFSFNQGYQSLEVASVSEVSLWKRGERREVRSDRTPWESVAAMLAAPPDDSFLAAAEFTFDSPRVTTFPELAEYAKRSFLPGRPFVESLFDLTGRIHRDLRYEPLSTTVTTPVDEVFESRRGVCQDFAHLEIAMLRSIGLSARYVSGYLRTHSPAGQPRLVGADASHAWVSAFVGALGWIDIDPTNNLLPDDEHITVAWGRDYGDVTPLKGVFIGGGRYRLQVSVDVCPA